MTETHLPNLLGDPNATRITAGDTAAEFLPNFGMIGVSLKKDDIEALRRVDNLIVAAAANRTVGIPFLFPFANRLADFRYEVAGRGVTLPPHALVLRYDENGLPMHGLMWPHLKWDIADVSDSALSARLDWSHPQGLAVFPYPCQLTLSAQYAGYGLKQVHRDANGPRLFGNRTIDRLADPPGSVSAEFVAAPRVKLVDRPQQPQVPLLNQVQE